MEDKRYAMVITVEDGTYYGKFVDFDAIADGESEEELIENAREVLALELADLADRGETCEASEAEADNVVYISASDKKVKTIYAKKTVTLRKDLADLAKENNLCYSHLLAEAIKECLNGTKKRKEYIKKNVTIPAWLDLAAKENKNNLCYSELLSDAIREKLDRR